MTSEKQIEKILLKAEKRGCRQEVLKEAQHIMAYLIGMDDADCYSLAFGNVMSKRKKG